MTKFEDLIKRAYEKDSQGFSYEDYRKISIALWAKAQSHISSAEVQPFRIPKFGAFVPMPNRAANSAIRKIAHIERGINVENYLAQLQNLVDMIERNFPDKIKLVKKRIDNAETQTKRLIESRLRLPGAD